MITKSILIISLLTTITFAEVDLLTKNGNVVDTFDAVRYDASTSRYNASNGDTYGLGPAVFYTVTTVSEYDGTLDTNNIISVVSLEDAMIASQATLDTLTDVVWAIADAYGVTNSPLNWFTLDAAIETSAASTNDLTAMQALRAGMRLDKNALFLKEWGVDLFNITR